MNVCLSTEANICAYSVGMSMMFSIQNERFARNHQIYILFKTWMTWRRVYKISHDPYLGIFTCILRAGDIGIVFGPVSQLTLTISTGTPVTLLTLSSSFRDLPKIHFPIPSHFILAYPHVFPALNKHRSAVWCLHTSCYCCNSPRGPVKFEHCSISESCNCLVLSNSFNN